MNKKIDIFQWSQLLAVSLVHLIVDLYAGMLAPILPVLREDFSLTLSMGGVILFALFFCCNFVQLLIGHMREDNSRPMFMHIGLLLCSTMCIFAILPKSSIAFPMMIILAAITGTGIAIAHPEGLRAVHALKNIPPSMGSAVFIAGGYIGYAVGGWLSSILVTILGLKGLLILIAAPVGGIVAIILLKVRLAVEPKQDEISDLTTEQTGPSFLAIMIMTIPATISITVISAMLPSLLNELGFELTFGGFSVMLFGIGAAAGSFVMAAIAHKIGELRCAVISFFAGVPLLLLHIILIKYRMAVWLLFAGSFCSASSYPLMVTLARHAKGLNLGQRMGIVIGGAWGIAAAVTMGLWPLAEYVGLYKIMLFAPAGFVVSGIIGVLLMSKTTNE